MYRLGWITSTAILTASCLAYDAVSGGWLRLVVLGPGMALFGGLLGFVLTDDRPDRWTWARRGMVWAGVGAIAADALVATFGGLGALIGMVLLLTSPTLLRRARDQFLAWSTRRTTGPPETLATRELLRRWEWTTGEVSRSSTSVARRLALVQERRTLLDEVQRRDPTHFDDWMTTAVPVRAQERARRGGETR